MSPELTEKVRKARDQARWALGRSEDQLYHCDRAGPPRSQRVEPSRIKFMPAGESVPVLTLADVAHSLGIAQARVAAMVPADELAHADGR